MLLESPNSSLMQLCEATRANSGHLAVMLRTLTTLGWVVRSQDGMYNTRRSVVAAANCDMLTSLCNDIYGSASAENEAQAAAWGTLLLKLARWLPSIEEGFELPVEAQKVPMLPTMLAGCVIAPLLLELHMMSADEGLSGEVSLPATVDATADLVGGFFEAQQWGMYEDFEMASAERRGAFAQAQPSMACASPTVQC